MENKLTTQLWSIAKEIARQFGEVIEMEPEFWVNDDPTDICAFGDTYFFTLTEMKQVIDNLPRYIKQYGTREAVGEEIRAWVDWWLSDATADQLDIEYTAARITHTVRPNINLKGWLDGCPRTERHPYDGEVGTYNTLRRQHTMLMQLLVEYGPNATISHVHDKVHENYIIAKAQYEKQLNQEIEQLLHKHGTAKD
jgi:hypothetical protein